MAHLRAAVILSVLTLVSGMLVAEQPLTNDDVIKLANLGIGDDAVIAKIHQAATVDFKLETDDLVHLKNGGVSGKVIAAMLDRSAAASVPANDKTPAHSVDTPIAADQIEADLLSVGSISAGTEVGMVEFTFNALSDFLDVQIITARERRTVREYDVELILPKSAVNSMSAMDAFGMLPGSKPQPQDNRPYRLLATIVYTKSGDRWTISKVNPSHMKRVSGAPRSSSRPPSSGPASAPASSEAALRTGLGYRVRQDDVAVYDKSAGGKSKGRLLRGSYAANVKGTFLGIPAKYQPEERDGKTHIAFIDGDIIVGWVDSAAVESFPYNCGCETTSKECTAIVIAWKSRTWSDCFQRGMADAQSALRKRAEELIRSTATDLARVPEAPLDIRATINAHVWGQYDSYQAWYIAALNRRGLAAATLDSARVFLEAGRSQEALDYAMLASRYLIDSGALYTTATAVLANSVVQSAEVLRTTYRASSEALRYGLAIDLGPNTPAYDVADLLITAADFGVDYGLQGGGAARRNLARRAVAESLLAVSGLSLESKGTRLLGRSGLYEMLARTAGDPTLAKEVMTVLGRSGSTAIGELSDTAVKAILDAVGRFASKCSDPAFSEASVPPQSLRTKSGKKQ